MMWPDGWDYCHETVTRADSPFPDVCGGNPVAAARCNDDGDRDNEGPHLYPVCEAHR